MKIKACVLQAQGAERPYSTSRPMTVEELDLDGPGPGEVLVKVAAAGVCHSDLSVVNGNRARELPIVLGHEGSGVVEEIGPGVRDFAPGDHVAFQFLPSCGYCRFCLEGRPSSCENGHKANAAGTLLSGKRRFSKAGDYINHQSGVSCYAEYCVCDTRSLVKVDKDFPLELAAVFSCAVITGVGAVCNTAKVPVGAKVGVVGLGGVGLSAMMGAKAVGAGLVIGLDPVAYKRDEALKMGADQVFDTAANDVVEQIKDLTGGGLDYVFECAGEVEAMELAIQITGRGGTTTSSGLSHPTKSFSASHVQLVVEERTIKGSYMGSCVPSRDIPAYIELYKSGRFPIDQVVCERIGLDQVNEAFDRLDEGRTLRQLIIP